MKPSNDSIPRAVQVWTAYQIKLLKILPEQMKKTILNLFNQSILESKIPENWKKAEITMIPKKTNDLQNPKS